MRLIPVLEMSFSPCWSASSSFSLSWESLSFTSSKDRSVWTVCLDELSGAEEEQRDWKLYNETENEPNVI